MTLDCSQRNQSRIEEPYRLFFPTGMAIGVIGVLLWPLFHAGWLPYYPNFAHTRLMVDGFAGLFVFGFLMTAGPRLLGVPAFSRSVVLTIFSLCCAACSAHLLNQLAIGDFLFSLTTGLVIINAIGAFRARSDVPPPGFPLAALGLLCACIGSLLLGLSASIWPNSSAFELGKILLYQGFTLLPIVGVGAFFFPKILGSSNTHAFPEMRLPNKAWKRRLLHSLFAALGFFASIALELSGQITLGYILRLAALGIYCIAEIPFAEFQKAQSMHGRQLLFSLLTIAIGFIGAAIFPAYKTAWLHAYFVVGLTGIIFLVSIRVVFGHASRPQLIRKSVLPSACIIGILALAAATRIFADFRPNLQTSHYLYAAAAWIACALVWIIFVAPHTRAPKPPPGSSC